jgi:hypothetical protein
MLDWDIAVTSLPASAHTAFDNHAKNRTNPKTAGFLAFLDGTNPSAETRREWFGADGVDR